MSSEALGWIAVAAYLPIGAMVAGFMGDADPIVGLFWPLAVAYRTGEALRTAVNQRKAGKPDTF